MTDRKMNKNLRELKSLRYRAHPQMYDRNVIGRKRRLHARIQHLKAKPETKA